MQPYSAYILFWPWDFYSSKKKTNKANFFRQVQYGTVNIIGQVS